jgi:hypothetical protein
MIERVGSRAFIKNLIKVISESLANRQKVSR